METENCTIVFSFECVFFNARLSLCGVFVLRIVVFSRHAIFYQNRFLLWKVRSGIRIHSGWGEKNGRSLLPRIHENIFVNRFLDSAAISFDSNVIFLSLSATIIFSDERTMSFGHKNKSALLFLCPKLSLSLHPIFNVPGYGYNCKKSACRHSGF